MKKTPKIISMIVTCALLFGCSTKKEVKSLSKYDIQNICKIATLDLYYQNVAKGTKSPGTGLVHTFETERKFFIRYTGKVTLGVNADNVDIKIKDNEVTVTMPKAEIISEPTVDAISANDIFISPDSFLNKNEIDQDDQKKAIEIAQNEMLETAKNDSEKYDLATDRAQSLIKSFIEAVGEEIGVQYVVVFNTKDS